ncbi:restriction endonuclease subunit S [Aeromonas salmonicida]|uniref:restriction endonuclease subunit S n=1 Tax=Aeromonas salmonicida TaxID=645 RepID=UPI00232DB2B1|nr:restriction endonuclease subunit S [Aeromonas salmonicida]WCH21563.1 restriction endonuclease subunit S [Aeromonas salmonicida]
MTNKKTVKLGDICREIKLTTQDPIVDGHERYIGLEHLDSGSLKIKRWGMIEEDNPSFTRVFKKGNLLIGKRRPYLKKAGIAEFDGICSGDIIVVESKKSKLEKDLLPFIVQSQEFWEWAVKTSSGSLSPRTKFKSLSEFELREISPEAQARLLNSLLSVEKSINLVDEALEQAYTLKRILITKFFSKNFVSKFEHKDVYLRDVVDIQSGQVDPREKPYCDLPHIAPDNMTKITGKLIEYRSAKQDGVTSGKYYFDESWALYSKIRPNLRKLCFPKFSGVCSADVYPIKGRRGLLTEYLFYLLQSEHFNRYAISTSTRSGFPKINRDDLGAYRFYLPEEKAQTLAISKLVEVDKTIESCLSYLSRPAEIKSAMISKEIGI